MTKTCDTCSKEFRTNRQSSCRNCRAKAERLANPEKHRAYQHARRREKREQMNGYNRGWYARNKEKCKQRRKELFDADPEKYRNMHRAWKAAHPQRVKELGLADYYRHKDVRNAKSKIWYEALRAKADSNPRPIDWFERPFEWRVIGDILLSREGYMSNADLAKSLDASRLIQCPYGEKPSSWSDTISQNDCKKFVNKIRGWVGRPGRRIASIPSAISA